MPTIHSRVSEVTYCALPESSINHHIYSIQVAWRGSETYAVVRMRQCLGMDGEWDYEPIPSDRDGEWIATHRFDYQTACRLAAEAAPSVRCNRRTAAEVAVEEATDV